MISNANPSIRVTLESKNEPKVRITVPVVAFLDKMPLVAIPGQSSLKGAALGPVHETNWISLGFAGEVNNDE